MTFHITTSEIFLPYRFNHTYFQQISDLRKLGNTEIGFSDADISDITKFSNAFSEGEIRFYKERLYYRPNEIVFTIFNVPENLIITELHVILSEKRCFFRVNRPCRITPDMGVTLKITQDPNDRTWLWTGLYS